MTNTVNKKLPDSQVRRDCIRNWLSCSFQWRIPVYQRHYAWDAEIESSSVHLFWEIVDAQARRLLDKKPMYPYYFGAVLVDNKTPKESLSDIKKFDVVDGQQRLTTIHIALFALITAGDKFRRRKGNSPDRRLRSPNTSQWETMWEGSDSQEVGLEAAIL